ncbi:hypothetical protein [Winogradskyella aurantiaca]|uniref:hypothetical protein n=1 Tax=Winogradskyella aurantiaca TaxID=2219558 RepID=UPI000E1C7CF3|nr:hypothetical protein [Winogradskyella aurantiaca]
MKTDISVVTGFLNSIETYQSIFKIELLQSESNGVYKAFKVIYLDKDHKKVKLRIELDFVHEKLSAGFWKDPSLKTKKFSHFLG